MATMENQSARSATARPTMRAAVSRRFGGPEVVMLESVPRPEPKAGEVLVRVKAAGVSVADHRMRSRDLPRGLGALGLVMLGVFRPRHPILGVDAAGVVEAVGAGVEGLAPGDEVVAMPGFAMGCHAEFVIAKATQVGRKPHNLSFEEAAALPFGGSTALSFLAHVELREGVEVLVNGGSSAVGSIAVQLAARAGARVTAVTSTRNIELVRSLGADRVIDYTTTDFAAEDATYDVIVECVGNAPFARVEPVLRKGGTLLLVVADLPGMLGTRRHSRRLGGLVTYQGHALKAADILETLATKSEAGELVPVVDRVYDFDDAVEAHRYVDTGRKRGNVILRVG
jgi:NADPH:quinone reductase-like Zn-dependent oxidoreductase